MVYYRIFISKLLFTLFKIIICWVKSMSMFENCRTEALDADNIGTLSWMTCFETSHANYHCETLLCLCNCKMSLMFIFYGTILSFQNWKLRQYVNEDDFRTRRGERLQRSFAEWMVSRLSDSDTEKHPTRWFTNSYLNFMNAMLMLRKPKVSLKSIEIG